MQIPRNVTEFSFAVQVATPPEVISVPAADGDGAMRTGDPLSTLQASEVTLLRKLRYDIFLRQQGSSRISQILSLLRPRYRSNCHPRRIAVCWSTIL